MRSIKFKVAQGKGYVYIYPDKVCAVGLGTNVHEGLTFIELTSCHVWYVEGTQEEAVIRLEEG